MPIDSTNLSPEEFSDIASKYLDGSLSQEEVQKFLEHLRTNKTAAQEFEVMRKIQSAYKNFPPLQKDEWFYHKLERKLHSRQNKATRFQTFSSQKFAFSSTVVLIVAVISIFLYRDSALIDKYFSQKKNQVQDLYESAFINGSILPLFSNLTKDNVLQFALQGSIPIDSIEETQLRVNTDKNNKAKVEIVREKTLAPQVSYNEFVQNLELDKFQSQHFDSLFDIYAQRIQASVLTNGKDKLAFSDEIGILNKEIAVTIASSLRPTQRKHLEKYLQLKKIESDLATASDQHIIAPTLVKVPVLPRSKKYVIVSEDSISIAELHLSAEKLAVEQRRLAAEFQKQVHMRQFINQLADDKRSVAYRSVRNLPQVQVNESNQSFQIHFEQGNTPLPPSYGYERTNRQAIQNELKSIQNRFEQQFRLLEDSTLVIELNADPKAIQYFRSLPNGEFLIEHVDSNAIGSIMKLRVSPFEQKTKIRKAEPLIDLDSLIEESNRKESGRDSLKKSKIIDL